MATHFDGENAVWRALSARFYERKVVRDLLWAVTSPHLIDAERFPVLSVTFGVCGDGACAATLTKWLADLETDPTHLVTFLQEKTKSPVRALALGVYFASLLEYWLRFSPLLRISKFELGKQIISSSNQTLGQLKFLFRLFHATNTSEKGMDEEEEYDDFHVESSVKFFLLHPLDGDESKQQDKTHIQQAHAETSYPLEQFVGPHLGENLAWRVQEVARKLDMCTGESVQSWLCDHYSDSVQSKIVLKGYLFYPLRHFHATCDATRGHDWRLSLHHHPSNKTAGAVEPRCNDQVGVDHLRGWWTTDLEHDFASKIRAHNEANHCESRFLVLSKLHWLSPVVAHETNCNSDGDAGESVSVGLAGDNALRIEPIESMSLEQLLRFARSHFPTSSSNSSNSSGGGSAGLVMPLLVAEIVRCVVPSDPANHRIHHTRWREQSRGFLLDPNCWDPRPLCHDAVRYKRSSPTTDTDADIDEPSAVSIREYEGRRAWVNDGVIKPTDQEAERLRQEKRHAFIEIDIMAPRSMCEELLEILDGTHAKKFTHANLKQSIQAVLMYQHQLPAGSTTSTATTASTTSATTVITGREGVSFVFACLRYLVFELSASEAQASHEKAPYPSKVVQRVAHLLLDAFDAIRRGDGQSSQNPDLDLDFGYAFLVEVAQSSAHWDFINVSLRMVEILHQQRKPQIKQRRFQESLAAVVRSLAAERNPRWNAVAVDIVRVVFFSSASVAAVELRRELLQSFMSQQDWKNAELLVTTCSGDAERDGDGEGEKLFMALYTCLANQKSMAKPMKRLEKVFFSRYSHHHDHRQHHQAPSDLSTTNGSINADGGRGRPLDVDANLHRAVDQIPSFQWTLVDTPALIDEMLAKLQRLLVAATNAVRDDGDEAAGVCKIKPILVGLDCEWRPQFVLNEETEARSSDTGGASLYQVAVGDSVYVVDVQVLGAAADAPLRFMWLAVPRGVFIIVGFCVAGDLRRLHRSFPSLRTAVPSNKLLLVELKRMALDRHLPAHHWGLSQLYFACFHGHIDKEQQCSDWGARPLSTNQLQYAAMDAFAVRNIALFLLADLGQDQENQEGLLLPYVEQFAVRCSTEISSGLMALHKPHWLTPALSPLNQTHVRDALIGLGLHQVAESIAPISSHIAAGGLVVKTIAIMLRHGGHKDSDLSHKIHYVAVVLDVTLSIDMAALASYLDVHVDDLVLADKETPLTGIPLIQTLLRVFGYPRGSIGPIGLRQQQAVHVVLDAALLINGGHQTILPGAGQEDLVYRITPEVLCGAMGTTVVAISGQ